MSVVLLSTLGCGKVSKNVPEKVVKKDEIDKMACETATVLADLTNAMTPDYDIKIHQETMAKVLIEMDAIKSLEAKDFWSSLSAETRDELNYELMIMMTKKEISNPQAVYQSVAYFFSQVKDDLKDYTAYKLKDTNGMIFSFAIRAQKTDETILMNFKCGRHEPTDLSSIKIVPEILFASEINEIYECRTLTKSMVLMEVRDVLFLTAGKKLHRLPLADLKKENKKRDYELDYQSLDTVIKIRIKKNKTFALEAWQGKKSKIKLRQSGYEIDEVGACNRLKHAFEI